MTDIWAALTAAVRPTTLVHMPFAGGSSVPVERLLDAAERTAADIVRACDPAGPPRFGLMMANGEPWLRGLLAAFRAGGAAVPLAMPTSASGLDGYLRQTSRVAVAARLDAILFDGSSRGLAARLRPVLPGVALVDISQPPPGAAPAAAAASRPEMDDLAVIQYTSGSTSSPKGVPLTHGNVLAGAATILETLEYTDGDVLGMWLPLFHDMGLFSVLASFLFGTSVVLWRPVDFVRDPLGWLVDFARAGATTSPAPNFAYDYLVASAAQGVPAGTDLSRWRCALNGAEPVRRGTVAAFHRTFAPYGLPADAMSSCYGLAEATLMVTLSPATGLPRSLALDRHSIRTGQPVRPGTGDGARHVVSVGRVAAHVEARIQADGATAPDGVVGEIQVRGRSVTRGYLDLPADEQPVTADGWLRTGDLGFVDGGEFFVVGRTKDMIVVRGQNYYAEDVEELVLRQAGLAGVRCAAFQIDDGSEDMVVVLETPLADPDEAAGLARTLETATAVQLAGSTVRVLPVAPRSIPVTTSGKVKRYAVRHEYGGSRPPATDTSQGAAS